MNRLITLLLCIIFPAAGMAAEIKVLSAGAVSAAVKDIVTAFEKETGHSVKITFAPVGVLQGKLVAGEKADVLILSDEAMEPVGKVGPIVAASRTKIGVVGIGVAVNEKAPLPDISTPEAFKQTLLRAKSIVYIDPTKGTSGKHFAGVLKELGIEAEMKPKTLLLEGGYVVEPVGKGEIELGVHQISEILPVKGVKLVGPLPAALQKNTIYVAAVMQSDAPQAAASEFVKYLVTPASRTVFLAKGFTAP